MTFNAPWRQVIVVLVLAAVAVLAPAASAAKRPRGTATLAELGPLFGHAERGVVHLVRRPGSDSVRAGVIAGDDLEDFTLVLSRRRCSGVASNPSRPRYIGEPLFDAEPIQGFYIDDIIIGAVPRRSVRAARSVVLLGTGDGGKLEPRACGNARTARLGAPRPNALMGLLLPFTGYSERVNLHLAARRGTDRLTLVGDFNPDGDVNYRFRLSRRSCAGVRRHMDRPRYVGRPLSQPDDYTGIKFADVEIEASRRQLRAARSIVLVGRERGGGKFAPRGCGRAGKLEFPKL